jgi:hypothetical protein
MGQVDKITSNLKQKHQKKSNYLFIQYFKELKKLIALKKRRVLGEMLVNTNERIKNVDLESKVFTRMKKEAYFLKDLE